MRISAIIAAAGKGTRIDPRKPKQFMEINGRPMLAYSLDIFENCDVIYEVIVVSGDLDLVRAIIEKYCYKKVRVVLGGETRQDSVYAGLSTVLDDIDIVLVHDGARPFITDSDIRKVADAAARYGSCTLGVKVKDTIKICADNNMILQTPTRDTLWAVQTPQGFKRELLLQAHEKAIVDGFIGTDDVVLAERIGHLSYVVPGGYENIKITTIEDLAYGEWLLSRKLT